jgi:hypothetical protein
MQRHGNASGAASPRGIYEAADGGWLSIAASNQSIALRLFEAMGRPDLKDAQRFATNTARMANNDAMQQIVIDWVKSFPRDKALEILDQHEVVAAAVNDAKDVTQDPHFSERTLVELAGTVFGQALMPGPILHVKDYDGPVYDGVPTIGQHTREVLEGELAFDVGPERETMRRPAGSFALVPQIRTSVSHPDPMGLRETLVQQLSSFEEQAGKRGIKPEAVLIARYALCTLIDEAVSSTPWGGASQWMRESLLITFHREAGGGERVAEIVARHHQPGTDVEARLLKEIDEGF